MRKHIALQFPKTQDGHDLSSLLRRMAGRRTALATILAHTAMAWACSDRSNQPWAQMRSAETVRFRIDLTTFPMAPVYRMWERSQTDMAFTTWLAMATYHGFARIRKEPLLAPMLEAFSGDVEAPVKLNLEPIKARPAKKNQEKPVETPAAPTATAAVKTLKGMF